MMMMMMMMIIMKFGMGVLYKTLSTKCEFRENCLSGGQT
jgi:hypothetical protein